MQGWIKWFCGVVEVIGSWCGRERSSGTPDWTFTSSQRDWALAVKAVENGIRALLLWGAHSYPAQRNALVLPSLFTTPWY